MIYSQSFFLQQRFQARWAGQPGQPRYIEIRDPTGDTPAERQTWWAVDQQRWHAIERDGLRPAFKRWTAIAALAQDNGNGGPPIPPTQLPPLAATSRNATSIQQPAATEESPTDARPAPVHQPTDSRPRRPAKGTNSVDERPEPRPPTTPASGDLSEPRTDGPDERPPTADDPCNRIAPPTDTGHPVDRSRERDTRPRDARHRASPTREGLRDGWAILADHAQQLEGLTETAAGANHELRTLQEFVQFVKETADRELSALRQTTRELAARVQDQAETLRLAAVCVEALAGPSTEPPAELSRLIEKLGKTRTPP